jgi:hypothetical protein
MTDDEVHDKELKRTGMETNAEFLARALGAAVGGSSKASRRWTE